MDKDKITAQDVYIALWVNYRHFPETVPGKFLNDGIQDAVGMIR